MILLPEPLPESVWANIPVSQCAVTPKAICRQLQSLELRNLINGFPRAKGRMRREMNLFAEDIVLFPRKKPNLLPKARSRRIRPHRGGRAGKIGRNEWLGDLRKLTRTMEIAHAFIDSYGLRAPYTTIIRIHMFILPKLKNPTELICASGFAPNYTPFPLCPQVLRKKQTQFIYFA